MTGTDAAEAGSGPHPAAPVDPPVDAPIDVLGLLAVEAACAGARFVHGRLDFARVDSKSTVTDLVTDVDRDCESHLVALLHRHRPDDAVLGEEGGGRTGAGDRTGQDGSVSPGTVRWIIDPIDGTVNFVHGLPFFAVSVAAELAGVVVAGCVVDVMHGEVFAARRGAGATVARLDLASGATSDSRAARGPSQRPLAEAVVGTGFAYDAAVRARQGAVVAGVIGRVANLRRLGSAALDLCYVADGRLDGYFEAGTMPWDRAAGELVATEAGATVGTIAPTGPHDCIIAAGPRLFAGLRDLLAGVGAASVMSGPGRDGAAPGEGIAGRPA